MAIYLDTGNLDEIKRYHEMGIIRCYFYPETEENLQFFMTELDGYLN